MSSARYASVVEFYEHPVRRSSPERDLGLRWRSGSGATYRAAWIRDTEELYCVRHGLVGCVEVLVRVSASDVDHLLAGWRDVCGQPCSYEWLRRRCAQASSTTARPWPTPMQMAATP